MQAIRPDKQTIATRKDEIAAKQVNESKNDALGSGVHD
jgi:hypothetical protein